MYSFIRGGFIKYILYPLLIDACYSVSKCRSGSGAATANRERAPDRYDGEKYKINYNRYRGKASISLSGSKTPCLQGCNMRPPLV